MKHCENRRKKKHFGATVKSEFSLQPEINGYFMDVKIMLINFKVCSLEIFQIASDSGSEEMRKLKDVEINRSTIKV